MNVLLKSLPPLLFLASQLAFSQRDVSKTSNTYYFSAEDSIRMHPARIASQRIKSVTEVRKSKTYGDTLIIIHKYYFSETGLLTQVDSYDVHGVMKQIRYESDSVGHLSRIVSFESPSNSREINFDATASHRYEFKTSHDSSNRLVQLIKYLEGEEIDRVLYSYGNRKVIATSFRGSIVTEIRTQKYSKAGKLTKRITDRRMSVKRISKRDLRNGNYHNAQPRYSKINLRYDNQGNVNKVSYSGDLFARSRIRTFEYDNAKRLIKEIDKTKGESKKMYQFGYELYP